MSKKSEKEQTPVRFALRSDSSLQASVKDGVGAVPKAHRNYIHEDLRPEFADSLDSDTTLLAAHSSENRWDYLLGYEPQSRVVGLEPHTADDGEISVIIKKKEMALLQLRAHLKESERVSDWFWVASGKVGFTAMEKATRRLDEKGITFVGKVLLKKHLG